MLLSLFVKDRPCRHDHTACPSGLCGRSAKHDIMSPCAPAHASGWKLDPSNSKGQSGMCICGSLWSACHSSPEKVEVAAAARQSNDPAAMVTGAANATMRAAALEGHGVWIPDKAPRMPICGDGRKIGGFVVTPTLLAAKKRASSPTASKQNKGITGICRPGAITAPSLCSTSLEVRFVAQANVSNKLRAQNKKDSIETVSFGTSVTSKSNIRCPDAARFSSTCTRCTTIERSSSVLN
mmetsp:Transcript_59117/g.117113  ORF Transcript_59117/g.117113 Transcript_59117/m.117113 type:complete len:238 (-) Transcript_59117:8-721(-)